MFKLTYQKNPMYFAAECYFKDIAKNLNEKK